MSYPAGAQNDSRAPYNQHEQECPDCLGTKMIDDEECETCNGTGIVEGGIPSKAEREYDPEDSYDESE